ncbi:alkaline phosphatase family protein [Mucilaginibacter sp.]|jgi:predicted AlkP superfamily pyrophosphatase or phosphodiesterase|uniref:alkaline phosphatase family protein n=1 Tax=Mucilaginibacter sp. TaxID=1882438 RepID=UPI0035686841
MKKIKLFSLAFVGFGLGLQAQTYKHIILISIDGLHPDMYLDKSWPAPNLRELMKHGTYADHMLSVFPSYTYPSHAAMLTGALPSRSGIYYNQPISSKGDWNWFASAVKVPTLWKVMKQAGLTTAAVEWPVSVGKDITWNIPEIWSDRYPDRITESRKYATPGLVEEIEQNATGKLDSDNMSEDRFSMDANSARMAAYIFKTYHPALLAVHFAEVDGAEHAHGRDGDSVRLAVGAVDRAIGDVLEAVQRSGLKDSTVIVIVGDHGFSTIHTVFRPNMLIKDINATFIAAGGSAFLYRYADTKEEDVAEIIKSTTQKLNALPKDKRKLFRIVYRKELNKMGADSSAIMALAAVPGTVFSGSTAPAKATNKGPGTLIQNDPLAGVFIPTTGGHHGYDPNLPEMYTGFIAYGAGINKGGHIKELCVTDIAPLIANLLGIEFKTPDGKLISGIMRPN